MISADFSEATKSPLGNSCLLRDAPEISLGKPNHFPCTTAKSTLQPLDGCGLCDIRLTRPGCPASYLVPVRQLTGLLHASFRHYLAITPLRFTNPSPPSGWVEDFHLLVVRHAKHTLG
jgi:hypothetical protein